MNLAFISYSHHDAKVAEWLQNKLEHYRLPGNLTNPVNAHSNILRPIFRDRTDLTAGVLSEVIDYNLENSRFLILICSRRSARSEWVSKEVQYFIEHGRISQIIPLVIDGIPYSGNSRECMPKYLRDYVAAHPGQELLCIDRVSDGDERSFMQVVSRIMEMPFEVMFEMHRRRRNLQLAVGSSLVAGVLAVGGFLISPISSSVRLVDPVTRLCHGEGQLIVDGQYYAIPDSGYNMEISLQDLPGYRRGSTLELTFKAPYYDTIRTSLTLGFGFHSVFDLDLQRDATFAVFQGIVVDDDGMPVRSASVRVGDIRTETDFAGRFRVDIPLDLQQVTQPIMISRDGFVEFFRDDECPDTNLHYILHRTL